MKGEFHIHTTYSDGEYSVDEILEYLKGNIDYFCITDHDCLNGSIEAFNKAKEYGLKSLVGVEISTYLGKESVHVLGYFKDDNGIEELKDFLEKIRLSRVERAIKMKDLLFEHFGFVLDIEEVLKKNSITRGTIARQIIKQTDKYPIDYIFKNMIGSKSPAYVPVTKIEPKEAINIIHKCNGVAILAHPVKLKRTDFKVYYDMGIDGYEAIYPTNTEEETQIFKDFCNEKGLVYTAGTDFHYFNCNNHGDLLSLSLDGEELERFLDKVMGVKNER